METLDLSITYKNADNCKECPKRNDAEGCPWFWEWVETNGPQERLRKQCGKQAMQFYMVEVIKASNRPAAAVEETRNLIVKGFERLADLSAARIAMQASNQKPQPKGLVSSIKKILGKGS